MILIDGDTVAYRASASCEPTKKKTFLEPEREAIFRADAMMVNIMLACKTEDHLAYFSCSADDNFRYRIEPTYKIRRRGIPKPTHYGACMDHLFRNWSCSLCFGYEADDGIGINYMDGDIVAANDKDMLQIAGKHYNFVKDEFQEITEYQGQWWLWSQMLIGDYSDSIVGVPGIGPSKAEKILKGLSPTEMAERVMELYDDPARFTRNFHLLRILRSEEDYETAIREVERQETAAIDAGLGTEEIPGTGA